MIDDFLDFSKIAAGKLEVNQPRNEPARLSALVLVAEDNQVNLQITRYLLESLGIVWILPPPGVR